jgi:TPR repeat protein
VHNKYKSFHALKAENEEFRRTMLAVRRVLHDIRKEDRVNNRTSLRMPLQMIEDAIEMGEKVMKKCSNRNNKLKIALVCSQDYVDTLKAAGVKMNHGLTMITATNVNIHADTQGAVDTAQRAIESMEMRLDAYHNDILDKLPNMADIKTISDEVFDEVIAKLREEGIVASKQDCMDQIRDIQEDPDLTELKNEQLLQWALHVSLPPPNRPIMDEKMKKRLTCPISLDYMRDPVTLVQSGQTYDKASLCESLLQYPDFCPKTGQHFDEKLSYINNSDAREDLTYYLGDDAYQPYDDSMFKRQYEALWRERMNASTSPIDKLAALLFGMNHSRVDWEAAQDLVNDTTHENAVLTGFKALLLHPKAFQSNKLRKNEAESLRFWRRAEELGLSAESNANNKWAQCVKGMYHFYVSQDYAKARHFYELAAEQGNAVAQANLGNLYDNGLGVTQDYAKAGQFYELAAEQGLAEAQNNLGFLFQKGLGITQDYKKARHFYELAAEQGHALGQNNLGYLYDHGLGVTKDYAKARHFYELVAEQGDANAQYNLGNLYVIGRGVKQDYSKALHFYELAAEQGHAVAQNNIGYLYEHGLGVTQDYAKARHFYELVAEQGLAEAQNNLGNLYRHGLGVTQDYAKARHFYELAAEQGNATAQANLGNLYDNGLGVTQDYAKAGQFYELAAEQGLAEAQNNLGFLFQKGLGVTQDYAKARHFYELAAEQGNASGQNNLGYLYREGLGVTKDYAKARHFYELVAEQGDADAQYHVGNLYAIGRGATQDYAKALHFYELAAEQGHAVAQNNVGYFYDQGLGVTQDYAKAQHLYELAAEQGLAEAQNNLGYLYRNGLGVTQDYAMARHFYELAAEQGDASAQFGLGILFEEGKGVPVNKEKARHYYGLAAAQGDDDAQRKLEEIAKRAGAFSLFRRKR